jgi:hypothetical protein
LAILPAFGVDTRDDIVAQRKKQCSNEVTWLHFHIASNQVLLNKRIELFEGELLQYSLDGLDSYLVGVLVFCSCAAGICRNLLEDMVGLVLSTTNLFEQREEVVIGIR